MKARIKETGEIVDLAHEVRGHKGESFQWSMLELIPEPCDEFPYNNPSDTLDGEIENIWKKLSCDNLFTATKEGFEEVIRHFVGFAKQKSDEPVSIIESFRAEAAKDILCVVFEQAISKGDLTSIKQYPELIQECIMISDELIEQLKEKEEK